MEEYALADWSYDVPADQVMVMHTLAVEPEAKGKGYGAKFLAYYEEYALKHGCHYLRIDTMETNQYARTLYQRLGYREVSIISISFNGISESRLVCLEKKI